MIEVKKKRKNLKKKEKANSGGKITRIGLRLLISLWRRTGGEATKKGVLTGVKEGQLLEIVIRKQVKGTSRQF